MKTSEKKFIIIILIIIILLSGILIYKIKRTPKYNKELYNEIYSEYTEMLNNIESNSNIKEENEQTNDNTIYIISNSKGQQYRVIGEISIPKININYPIICETTEDYLKIAPTKLFGPDVNEEGNLCLAGHNYKNDKFFSKISQLNVNDKVYLKSNKRHDKKLYLVYDKFEILKDDLECTNQETNGGTELTLITCTSNKKKRLVVKCRAVK